MQFPLSGFAIIHGSFSFCACFFSDQEGFSCPSARAPKRGWPVWITLRGLDGQSESGPLSTFFFTVAFHYPTRLHIFSLYRLLSLNLDPPLCSQSVLPDCLTCESTQMVQMCLPSYSMSHLRGSIYSYTWCFSREVMPAICHLPC